MSALGGGKANEFTFQNDMLKHLVANGWLLGKADNYNRELALYPEDLLGFVQDTQPEEWKRFCALYPSKPEQHFMERVASQLNKSDPNAASKDMRTFGTLGVLRHELRHRGTRFSLCQFKPEHDLNPDTLARYTKNRCRVVQELVYSPWATREHLELNGSKAQAWRIDLVLFVNGLPVVTLELKSEFKQAVQKAIKQYKTTRFAIDPVTKKSEPLLTFKRGALVHFAVSQYEVYMATRLEGADTYFLPFNKGTSSGGAGNDVPEDLDQYATDYLWNEVLLPSNLMSILGHFVHLQIEDKEDWEGRKYKKESLIFPRYHQWDVVNKLVNAARTEGPGQKYLVQHSAGSGKSNSIAWVAHQLSALYDAEGNKQFNSVIVVTDRTVLDDQLQDTINQFEHVDGAVGRINNQEGDGPKSEKLANALVNSQPIIIVTIQTFPFVMRAIENSANLKERCYAIIADEAHSSQTGSTARQLKEVLMIETKAEGEDELSSEDILDAAVASRRVSKNLSYFAFTATPKTKTLELFGRLPKPDEQPSITNKPEAYHVYSMRQAIEEGFILDVLKNYTNYKVAYNLAQKIGKADQEVESKKAKVKVNQWVRLHEYNIAQKVQVIVEHFRTNVMGLLGGQAKAMVVTSSRKEAVRYKLCFDKYIVDKGYQKIHAMVAFSGEVEFTEKDPNSVALIGEKYTESNMNPHLRGRDMRKAFDSDDYQVMVVANKFQTGFDQPKLCAMYVDKKLGGVECVQTLSRLNRTYPGKAETGTFVLDFFNEPQDILDSFQPYFQTAELADVSNPDLIFDLFEKLNAAGIYKTTEVEQFCSAFFVKNKSNAAIANICKPAVERWSKRYKSAVEAYEHSKTIFERIKKTQDAVLIANAENDLKECKKEKDALDIFKKDLGTFVRFYEFMSQIVDYDDKQLEKLSLYARSLNPMLRESAVDEEDIDLDSIVLSHYRVSIIRQQDLKLQEDSADYKLEPGEGLGSGRAKDIKEEMLSEILERLNELFVTDQLTDKDMVNYAYTIRDKVSENQLVMQQLANNTPEQALLGNFPKAIDDAIMSSGDAHQNQMLQLLSDPQKANKFARVVFDLLQLAT
ncbi:type I restriction endonuclease subunit R [Halopseudomonas pelagia]|uniref:Restriction endonuclease subunit R n=1 Tax=Halopseudomonas pelagia TaxID=553151 RepID=A0AA91U592_9GAMM|nr:DEAD/DEAH box helicase family protein [Halopseudomonas pelagia]PCD00956.1 restriction endonuclease subunit R [Halopseudomonas pelagia]QFY56133.1 type I restriction endonuclease subunit R [Halopseudomonas pelagia]